MISVIVATYNRADCLRECLNAVLLQTCPDIEVIVVLNGVAEHVRSAIMEQYGCGGAVRFIANTRNLLLCAAYNQGISEAKGALVACINDDVVIDPDFLARLEKAFIRDPRVGMACGKLLRDDATTIDSTGLFCGRSRVPLERGFNEKDTGQYDRAGNVFGVTGACAMYRKAMLDDVRDSNGYFDERFGMFYEDLDLSWRANRRGWKAYYDPQAAGYHQRGASSANAAPSARFLKRYYFTRLSDDLKARLIRNRYMTIQKNDSAAHLIADLAFIAAYECRMYAYLLLFSPRAFIGLFGRRGRASPPNTTRQILPPAGKK